MGDVEFTVMGILLIIFLLFLAGGFNEFIQVKNQVKEQCVLDGYEYWDSFGGKLTCIDREQEKLIEYKYKCSGILKKECKFIKTKCQEAAEGCSGD